ncbi:SDR family oxidoreductase [Sphingomonas jatrophae]|uniref:3(Or 17)beta-hydroxysteroid dehydrogenase n=1 Tax=Sphingomonas jatrophae TaxID=1166337 RepID=A0A1I6M3W6_9SPHN|nr:SDR family oxidoreductase [Sphingomonas jatrophae]SFS10364.1 3(or 17)beta-hydroxysteroid dehydrogenase [Sphingomonas jatrophae]
MSGRLAGKVAVVTGAAKGLGAAAARMFAAEGARVILTDVDAGGENIARTIGTAARFVHHDVRRESEWSALIAGVEAREGRLDILVNNAGVVELDTPEGITEDSYRMVMSVSVDGMVWGCKHAIPAMRRSGGGSVINLSSIAAVQGEPNNASYTAAKGAIDAYSRMVAVYCGQTGLAIRCNAVLPNGMHTPMVASVPEKKRAAAPGAGLLDAVPGGGNARGEPEDVGALLLFLASDESRWINGQSLVIDNGASITKGAVPSPA